MEYRVVKDFARYEVSDTGVIRNIKSGKILKQFKYQTGYLGVNLCKVGQQRPSLVHRVVGLAFIANPENKPTINHKNAIKTDNSLRNLEWCTQKENIEHAVKLRIHNFGERHGHSKFKDADIITIRKLKESGVSTKNISRYYGVYESTIERINKRKTWAHIT